MVTSAVLFHLAARRSPPPSRRDAQQIEHSINATDSEDALKYLPSSAGAQAPIGDYNHAVLSTPRVGHGQPGGPWCLPTASC